jgi:hypothetical protein
MLTLVAAERRWTCRLVLCPLSDGIADYSLSPLQARGVGARPPGTTEGLAPFFRV